MGEHLFNILREHFAQHGYWTVAIALLLENAGVPVPGETILLFASFLAYKEGRLELPFIILVGVVACTIGDNTGYWIGHRGGRPLLDRYKHIFRVKQSHIDHAERVFHKHGPLTIFFARFIFGMRIIAGPMAGVLRMPWHTFTLFNFLGAATWVAVISCVGYFFGSAWEKLLATVKDINIALGVVAVLAIVYFVWKHRREAREEAREEAEEAKEDAAKEEKVGDE